MPPARRALNLNALADDMPDLDRHMGCMAGIFQIFDRQRLLTAAPRGRQPRHKSLPPPPKGTTTNTIHPPPLPSSPSSMPCYSLPLPSTCSAMRVSAAKFYPWSRVTSPILFFPFSFSITVSMFS
jgi:hypothetical protein